MYFPNCRMSFCNKSKLSDLRLISKTFICGIITQGLFGVHQVSMCPKDSLAMKETKTQYNKIVKCVNDHFGYLKIKSDLVDRKSLFSRCSEVSLGCIHWKRNIKAAVIKRRWSYLETVFLFYIKSISKVTKYNYT